MNSGSCPKGALYSSPALSAIGWATLGLDKNETNPKGVV